jgi:hypothetical protein
LVAFGNSAFDEFGSADAFTESSFRDQGDATATALAHGINHGVLLASFFDEHGVVSP